jgi:hypothetical protein
MFYHVPNINYILHTLKNKSKSFKPIIRENYFERLNIIIIEIFKFQNNCIYMQNRSYVYITSFELFDLEKIYISQDKLLIDKNNYISKIHEGSTYMVYFDMVGTSQIL